MKRTVIGMGILFLFSLMVYSLSYSAGLSVIPMTKWWELPSISSRLNLNKQEKDALHNLLIEKRLNLIDLKAKVKKQNFKLQDMIESENLNENAIIKEIELLSKANSELLKTRFTYLLGVRKILGFKRFEVLKEALMAIRRNGKKRILKQKKMGHHGQHGKWTK